MIAIREAALASAASSEADARETADAIIDAAKSNIERAMAVVVRARAAARDASNVDLKDIEELVTPKGKAKALPKMETVP